VTVLNIKEFKAVLFYTVLMVTSTGALLQNSNKNGNITGVSKDFLYGGMIAFPTIGIFTDLVLKGKYYYLTIFILHAISILALFVNIVWFLSTNGTNIL
jgi:hypothetical protein